MKRDREGRLSERRSPSQSMITVSAAASSWLKSAQLDRVLLPHMASVYWADAVGPQIAAVSEVAYVRDGVATVHVTNNVWAMELTLLREDIRQRLNEALKKPVIKEIYFRAKKRSKSAAPAAKEPPSLADSEIAAIALTPEEEARVEEMLIPITNETLRARVESTLLRIARINIWKREQGWIPCPDCTVLMPPSLIRCDFCRLGL